MASNDLIPSGSTTADGPDTTPSSSSNIKRLYTLDEVKIICDNMEESCRQQVKYLKRIAEKGEKSGRWDRKTLGTRIEDWITAHSATDALDVLSEMLGLLQIPISLGNAHQSANGSQEIETWMGTLAAGWVLNHGKIQQIASQYAEMMEKGYMLEEEVQEDITEIFRGCADTSTYVKYMSDAVGGSRIGGWNFLSAVESGVKWGQHNGWIPSEPENKIDTSFPIPDGDDDSYESGRNRARELRRQLCKTRIASDMYEHDVRLSDQWRQGDVKAGVRGTVKGWFGK